MEITETLQEILVLWDIQATEFGENMNVLKGYLNQSQSYKCISLTCLEAKQDMNVSMYNHSLIRDVVVSFTIRCCARGNDWGFYSLSVMWKVCHGSKQEEVLQWKRGRRNCLEGVQRDSTSSKHNPLGSVPCSAKLKGWIFWGIQCLPNCMLLLERVIQCLFVSVGAESGQLLRAFRMGFSDAFISAFITSA